MGDRWDAGEDGQDSEGEVVNQVDDAEGDLAEPESDQQGSGPVKLLPKHTIFLSHSGEDKAFVHQLCKDLKSDNYFPFFDQDRRSLPIGEEFPGLIIEAARTCLVGVIVLSEGFLTSKWPMKELMEFVKATKRFDESKNPNPNYNSSLKLVPVFYKKAPDDLKPPQLDELWHKLIQKHRVKMLPFNKKEYVEIIQNLCVTNGVKNVYGTNETKYRREVKTHILKLVPPALPIDTTDIHACERLCDIIFTMFKAKVTKRKGKAGDKDVECKYLGLYGSPGVGKTTICCEAMCHFYQVKYRGRICRVRLDSEGKAGDGQAAGGKAADAGSKRRLARLMTVIKQLVGLPKRISSIMTEKEGQTFLKDQLRHIKQPVFLVVDNVSESSLEEAKWYAGAEFPPASFVLVTSRRRDYLENVLENKEYCQRFPSLDEGEASTLFLSSAAPSVKSAAKLEAAERHIVDQCLIRCCIETEKILELIPRKLTTLATFLKDKGNILSWEEYIEQADNILGHEYDNLDEISKLMLLDLGFFASQIRFTHMDFHAELDWKEHNNFKLAMEFLAMLHGVAFHDAEKKVKHLQVNFMDPETITVSEDYSEHLSSVITRGVEEKKRCMVCVDVDEYMEEDVDVEYFYDLPDEDSSLLVRVALDGVSFDRDLHRIPEWRAVKLLNIHSVRNLPILDLQGLRSLRVLTVCECDEIEKIVCTCNSSFSDGKFCYDKKRGCLSELRVVQLEYLPRLKDASFAKHCRRLETLWFYECPDLGSLPDLSLCRKLKRLRLPCGDFGGFKGLGNNQALTELAFHWETDTVRNFTEDMRTALLDHIMGLTNLKILDIVDERELYDWIPAGYSLDVGELRFLTLLDLSCSSTIQEIEGLEYLSELTSLGLYGCCNLCTLPNLSKLKKLRRLCIAHCHSLPEFCEDGDCIPEPVLDSGTEENIEIEPFHALGERCSFREHECLKVQLNSEEEDSEDEYYPSDEELFSEEETFRGGTPAREKGVCKQCEPEKWKFYLAQPSGCVLPKDSTEAPHKSNSQGPAGVSGVGGHSHIMDVPSELLDCQNDQHEDYGPGGPPGAFQNGPPGMRNYGQSNPGGPPSGYLNDPPGVGNYGLHNSGGPPGGYQVQGLSMQGGENTGFGQSNLGGPPNGYQVLNMQGGGNIGYGHSNPARPPSGYQVQALNMQGRGNTGYGGSNPASPPSGYQVQQLNMQDGGNTGYGRGNPMGLPSGYQIQGLNAQDGENLGYGGNNPIRPSSGYQVQGLNTQSGGNSGYGQSIHGGPPTGYQVQGLNMQGRGNMSYGQLNPGGPPGGY